MTTAFLLFWLFKIKFIEPIFLISTLLNAVNRNTLYEQEKSFVIKFQCICRPLNEDISFAAPSVLHHSRKSLLRVVRKHKTGYSDRARKEDPSPKKF